MKCKIIIACILSTLVLSCTFGGASAISENEIEEYALQGSKDCIIYIIEPELGYIHIQFHEDEEPTIQLGPYDFFKNLNLAFYICFDCYQFFVDTFLDCPSAAKAKFSTKVWSTGQEIVKWDNDPSDGFSAFFDLPTNYVLYKETKVDVYNSNDERIGGHELDYNVFVLPIVSNS